MSVLVNGASGTGKEHVAQLIHRESKRAGKPFVAVDCGAIPRELAASEFFARQGAFTGPFRQNGRFRGDGRHAVSRRSREPHLKRRCSCCAPSGAAHPSRGQPEIPVDIRLVAATNEDLEAAIARDVPRRPLPPHQLFTLRMPLPAADARGYTALRRFLPSTRPTANWTSGSSGSTRRLRRPLAAYDWPGNLRQLRNTVLSATLLAAGEYVTCRDLPEEITRRSGGTPGARRFRCATARRRRSRYAVPSRRPAATSRRRRNCSASTARRSTTNCTFTASNSACSSRTLRVWNYSTLRTPVPHFSTCSPIFGTLYFALKYSGFCFLPAWHSA